MSSETTQHNALSVHDVLQGLYAELGITENIAGGKVTITGADPITPSVHRIGDAAAAALAAYGTEAAALWRERGGDGQDVSVSVEGAIHQLMAIFSTEVNGVSVEHLPEDENLLGNSDFYPTADGRHIYILMTYPKLRDAALEVLNTPPLRPQITEAVAKWNSFELEDAITSIGGTAAVVRTQEEWREHPQGKVLRDSPLINIEKIGESDPEPFGDVDSSSAVGPLVGVKVLDNTHVIAGPIGTRLTAELGANVLHISSPGHPDPNAMIIETNIGKRSAFCDLTNEDQAAQFWDRLTEADVYSSSYMGLEEKGFGPQALIDHRPGLIVLDFHGWGVNGPWSNRGGFDQLACSATGFSAEEGGSEGPKLPPTYLLNDYLAALLGAAGVIEALRRRAREGGSYRVHIDLAKVCMWVQDIGLIPRDEAHKRPQPNPAEVADKLLVSDGPWGKVSYLPTFLSYSSLKPRLSLPSSPLGAAPLEW